MTQKIPNGQHAVYTPTFGEAVISVQTEANGQDRFFSVAIGGHSILFYVDADSKIQNIGPRDFQALRNALLAIAMLADRFDGFAS